MLKNVEGFPYYADDVLTINKGKRVDDAMKTTKHGGLIMNNEKLEKAVVEFEALMQEIIERKHEIAERLFTGEHESKYAQRIASPICPTQIASIYIC